MAKRPRGETEILSEINKLEEALAAAGSEAEEVQKQAEKACSVCAGLETELGETRSRAAALAREREEKAIGDKVDNHNHRMRRCWRMCLEYNELLEELNSVGSEIIRLHQTRRQISDVESGDREVLKSPIRSLETGPKHVEVIRLGELPQEVLQEAEVPAELDARYEEQE